MLGPIEAKATGLARLGLLEKDANFNERMFSQLFRKARLIDHFPSQPL